MRNAAQALTIQRADMEVIARIQAGDMSAFEQLMRANNRKLYRTARAILRDDADAEEAVQDAYLKAYRALSSFRGESKRSTGLVRIAASFPIRLCLVFATATANSRLRRPREFPWFRMFA